MRFDQTAIAIRERSSLEVFDLAANVLVRHFRPILLFLTINALPFIVLNFALVGWMNSISFSRSLNFAYYWVTLMLVISQAQIGTCLVTIYLGRMMFMQDHSVGAVLAQFYKRSGYFLFSQGILRLAVFAPLAICWNREYESEGLYLLAYLLLPLIVCIGMFIRIARPYTPEVIFLEQTEVRKKGDSPSLGERSSNLHSLGSGFVATHFFLVLVIAPLLLYAVHSLFIMVDSTFNIRANSEVSLQPYYFVVAIWLVAGFIAVVRFLMYIDLRIRQEGWAIQLKFMTENNLLNQKGD
jgi:hypothetical protein